ncbi:hypothetical protein AX16_003910 [Volvariella volvacea WC 439]|nr:hypothetical protein AX16_003910 [Volvariella volvacea WC 439]
MTKFIPLDPYHSEDVERTPVYPVIQMIRFHFIDTALSYEVLTSPESLYTIVRPLEEKYIEIQRRENMSIVFCFLVTRIHFLRDDNLATAAISRTRAELCEILAIRVFRDYGNNMLKLTLALTTTWPVYNGADPEMLEKYQLENDEDLEDRVGNAIEIAILGRAKRFIKSSSCQRVIDGIWSGKYVYQAQSAHSILSDTYKRTPVHMYDPHKAPLLDHYRLKVPFIRSVLEYVNFLILFILFVAAIEASEKDYINLAEGAFMIYALGFTLEKIAAMQEHGIRVYFNGTWNGFDLAFITTYFIYGGFRLYGVYYHHNWARAIGIDCLAIIACLMFPRLAFVTLQNNLMVLSLRAMMVQFVALMCIAAFCFCGFLYALWTLSRNEAGYSAGTIAWWMLDLWFGLDASGFDRANQFHPFFGPILMVTYACLSNTLLLTVLVSILSNTFATINEDAAAEAMFRKAVSTIEGVKADVLFSYLPPVNLVALCIMLPASYILSPRWFHKVNVFMIRLTSFPVLLLIAAYERQSKKSGTIGFYDTLGAVAERVFDTLPRGIKRLTFFEGLAGSDSDIDAIFKIEDEFASALDTSPDDRDPRFQRTRPANGRRPSASPSSTQPQPASTTTGYSALSPYTPSPAIHGQGNGQLPSPIASSSPQPIHRTPPASSPPAQNGIILSSTPPAQNGSVLASQTGTPSSSTQVFSASPPQISPPSQTTTIQPAHPTTATSDTLAVPGSASQGHSTPSGTPGPGPLQVQNQIPTTAIATGISTAPPAVSLQPLRQRTTSLRPVGHAVRPRINSMVPRATADFMSPLAMLYQQPLLAVDPGDTEDVLLGLPSPSVGPVGAGAGVLGLGATAAGGEGLDVGTTATGTGGSRLTPPDETQELLHPQSGIPGSPAVVNFGPQSPGRRRLGSMQSVYRGAGPLSASVGGASATHPLPLHHQLHPIHHPSHPSHSAAQYLSSSPAVSSSVHSQSQSLGLGQAQVGPMSMQRQTSQSSSHSMQGSGLRNVVFPSSRAAAGGGSPGETGSAMHELVGKRGRSNLSLSRERGRLGDGEVGEEGGVGDVFVDNEGEAVKQVRFGVETEAGDGGASKSEDKGKARGRESSDPDLGSGYHERFEALEKKQERIESLLMQLMENLMKERVKDS